MTAPWMLLSTPKTQVPCGPRTLTRPHNTLALTQCSAQSSESGIAEGTGPSFNLTLERIDGIIPNQALLEILQFLPLFLLDLDSNLAATVEEKCDLFEVL